ncbi:MAG: hypothetical protein OEY86_03950 [Nitrospira sp.]|nr:hypothetical protein [Nitrospira sp.]
MLDVLSVFKRNTNQLFGICVDILNVGRSLQQLSLSMQILAINGVVQAAKVGDGKGRPILALVEILNHTPGEIRPEVETIERLCAKLAKLAAHSSNTVWRYYQLIAGLLTTIPREYRTSSRMHADAILDLPFTTPDDLAQLTAHPTFQTGDALARSNRQSIATICRANLTDLHERLEEALSCLDDTRRALHGLETIGLTARYMAFCIASEAAGLGEAGMNFKNLATEIGKAVDELNAKTHTMKVSIDGGVEMVELLLRGQAREK